MHTPDTHTPDHAGSTEREDALHRRIARLERTTRSLGIGLIAALVLIAVTYLLDADAVHDTVRTQALVIVDVDGNDLATLGATRQVTPARSEAHLALHGADGRVVLTPSSILVFGGADDAGPFPLRVTRRGVEVTSFEDGVPLGMSLTSSGLSEIGIVRMTRGGEVIYEADAPDGSLTN